MLQSNNINYDEFKSGLKNIPEPPQDILNTNHLEKPYQNLKNITNNFQNKFTSDNLKEFLLSNENSVDFLRYMLNMSQTQFSNEANKFTSTKSYSAQKKEIQGNEAIAADFAAHLVDDYKEKFEEERNLASKEISPEEFLLRIYTEKRRPAIEGQQHGDFVEDEVKDILEQLNLSEGEDYYRDKSLETDENDKDVDFVIPEISVAIECKGYVNTGSKLYDLEGDIRKINASEDYTVFLLLDGDILKTQTSLLEGIVDSVEDDVIDGVYQIKDINRLKSNLESLINEERPKIRLKNVNEIKKDLIHIPTDDLDFEMADEIFNAYFVLEDFYDESRPVATLKNALSENSDILTILRLLVDYSEDRMATELHNYVPIEKKFDKIKNELDNSKYRDEYTEDIARGLLEDNTLEKELSDLMNENISYFDIIENRYMQKAGKAIKSQYTGSYLEDKIENILTNNGLEKNSSFFSDEKAIFTDENNDGIWTKKGPDFVIPAKENPLIMIEAKGYTSTGSKQTDVKGDMKQKIIERIPESKRESVKVILVTDGGSWRMREPDLRSLVKMFNEGEIDGLYRLCDFEELEEDIMEIVKDSDIERFSNTEDDDNFNQEKLV